MNLTSCLLLLGIYLLSYKCGVTADNDTEPCGSGSPCPENAACNRTLEPPKCYCNPGFESFSKNITFKPSPEESCYDINECREGQNIDCGTGAECSNTVGNYSCICLAGYLTQSGKRNFSEKTEKGCVDNNECNQTSPDPCGPNAKCINKPGNYQCTCNEGYRSTSGNRTFTGTNESCQDINECTNISICGSNAYCNNTVGNYTCTCNNDSVPSTEFGVWTKETVCLKINCRKPSATQSGTRCKPTNDLLCELQGVLESAQPTCGSFKAQQLQSQETMKILLNGVGDLLNRHEWRNTDEKNIAENHQLATRLLDSTEANVKNLAMILPQRDTILSNDVMYIQVWKSSARDENIATLGNSTQMRLNRNTAVGRRDEGFAMAGLFSFRNMSDILSGADHIEPEQNTERQTEKVRYNVISDVVTAFVSNDQPYNLETPIKFTFALSKAADKGSKFICAYRKTIGNKSSWSMEGCEKRDSNADNVTCECNHLSSFAVLMALYDVESWTLDIITKVGLAISLVCLLLSIITFMFCRPLQGTRNTIHLHLCLSLFLAYAIFLAGITRVENKTACGIVAGLLHYFFLAAFCWMCLEGVELYLMVVKVFKTNAMKKRYMVLAGYGTPLVIVGISAAVRSSGYGTKKHCWLSLEHGFIWSFLAPITIIILVNAVIFIITVWKLAQKFSSINPDIDQLKKIRTFTITAIAQLCLLGCTWIIGIFQIDEQSIAMSYLFTIFNCLQGTFIFVLHCLLKKQVRDEYRRWFCAAVNLKTPSSYDKFSSSGAFSSSSQTRALRPTKENLHPTKESGM